MASSTARAIRPYFTAAPDQAPIFIEDEIEFDWHKGMSWQVKQRSSAALAAAILEKHSGMDENEILEVSTKSVKYEIGVALSAFNLMLHNKDGETHPVENWFQSSKRFRKSSGETCGPYRGLLSRDPLEAKRFLNQSVSRREKEGLAARYEDDPLFVKIQLELEDAEFDCFELGGREYPVVPRSAFYDYLYVMALSQSQNSDLAREVLRYSVFTDIEFNPKKGKKIIRFNTQARACAIFVALNQRDEVKRALRSIDDFIGAVSYQESRGTEELRLSL